MANGPRLKRGPVKAPAHKKSAVLKHAGTALHVIGGTPQRRLILAGVVGFLALGGIGWCGVNKLRAGCAADEAVEAQAVDEKEKREAQVDSFVFKARVQMINGKLKVKPLTELSIDKCETSVEQHSVKLEPEMKPGPDGKPGTTDDVFALEDAGEGFTKFKLNVVGNAHEKPVKFVVTEEVFADGAEREYELTAHRVDLTK